MVALLREFPGVQVTFNLVPSLLVQLEAFAADRARDRYLELSLKPAADLDDRRYRLHPRELLPRAAAADDRRLPALRGAAGAARRDAADRGGSPRGRRPLHPRRSPRPAGLAQAGVDRSVLPRRRRAHPRARGEGARLHGGRQGGPARGRTGAPEPGDPGVPGRRGARPDRAVGVAVLSPDSSAAVRHGHLPAHAPRRAACRASGSSTRKTRRSSSSGRSPTTNVSSAAGRSGCGRRRGRCPTRWCRWPRPRASRGWRPTS